MVTSKGTLDKLNPTARKYMAERAELLGAIRLPNTAFRQTANTEAVTDILFFKKRAEKISDTSGIEWLGRAKQRTGLSQQLLYPSSRNGSRYIRKGNGTVRRRGAYGQAGWQTFGRSDCGSGRKLAQNVYENPDHAAADVAAMDDGAVFDVRPMCYAAVKGKLYMRVGDRLVLQEIPAFPKDAYKPHRRNDRHPRRTAPCSGYADERLYGRGIKAGAIRIERTVRLFVRKYGFLNGQTNARLFREDGDAALLFACETLSDDKTRATKADIFTKRTIRPYAVPTHTGDTLEALQICRNERGSVI